MKKIQILLFVLATSFNLVAHNLEVMPFKIGINSNAKARWDEILEEEIHKGILPIKPIPKDIIGLGYQWYPIMIDFNDEADNFDVAVYSIQGLGECNKTAVNYSKKEIIQDVVLCLSRAEHPYFYSQALKPEQRFLDPNEVRNAIHELKSKMKGKFIGFMNMFDVLKFSIEGEDIYFKHVKNKIHTRALTNNYHIIIKLNHNSGVEDHIFSNVVKIKIKYRKKAKK
jgi:hypothetical protein